MQLSYLGKKPYTLLGRLLAKRMPEVAQALMTSFHEETVKPTETDHSKLEIYFLAYCQIRDIEPLELRGNLHKAGKIDVRREYIGSMLRLYNPQLYVQPPSDMIIHYGFVKSLANVLELREQNIGRTIRETVLREKVYEAFANQVKATVEVLIKREVTNGAS